MSFVGNWNVMYMYAVPVPYIPENVFVNPFMFIVVFAVF